MKSIDMKFLQLKCLTWYDTFCHWHFDMEFKQKVKKLLDLKGENKLQAIAVQHNETHD